MNCVAEVPLEDERSACGCTNVVFGGIRHQMPEKVFGNNWLELHHAPTGLVVCFDCASALVRWSELSLQLVDARRSGLPAWSGWTCDASQLREAWEASIWSDVTNYSRREEWDWCYRSDYSGTAHDSEVALGSCARRAAALQQHVLIRATSMAPRARAAGGVAAAANSSADPADPLAWLACTEAEAAAAAGDDETLWDGDEALLERYVKLS